MAIDRGLIEGAGQPLAELMPLPAGADPKLETVTVGNFLSMQTGLERTSGRNYGRWVDPRIGCRLRSLGLSSTSPAAPCSIRRCSHVMSALLTRVSGKSTWALADEWLAKPLGISIPKWQTDPKGIYFGGNNMALSPRALLAIGELYRNGGLHQGRRVLSENWVKQSWSLGRRRDGPATPTAMAGSCAGSAATPPITPEASAASFSMSFRASRRAS